MKKLVLTIAILLISLTSCGKKKVQADIALDFSQFALSQDYVNGMVLYGSSNNGDSLARIINGSNLSVDLTPGIWSFSVVAWKSIGDTSKFRGNIYCGKSEPVDLVSSNNSVNISISKSSTACSHLGNYSNTNYLFDNPTFNYYQNDNGACNIGTLENCMAGTAPAYMKIKIRSYNFFNGNFVQMQESLSSDCFLPTEYNDPTTYPVPSLPMVILPGVLAMGEIIVSSSATCDVGIQKIIWKRGRVKYNGSNLSILL